MSDDNQVFVDTNILVYAHDASEGAKHRIASEKVLSLWNRPLAPAVSVQVLQELYVNLIRKGMKPALVADIVENYLRWTLITNDKALLLDGIRAAQRFHVSLWDAMVLVAAKRASAPIVWSEDLNEGQDYDGVVVRNPLS